ncbi:MAG: GTPase HflX [Clostridia bacterium]|nr:GTPase HflX [Clostridia bacterium]
MNPEIGTNANRPERALLAGIDTGEYDAEVSLDELSALCESAGAEVIGRLVQSRSAPDGATFFGSGKLIEIQNICTEYEADLIVVDAELSPSQQRNIEDFTGIRTIDRTMLILDIFALHANSGEGKAQVELAQLKYSLPRLGGQGKVLSRLGGGIGTRGPGETQLETDRRHIMRRINSLEDKLERLKKTRKLIRDRRAKNQAVTVAIVGYTNAGKSTLMNTLTNAGVLTENKLFATLDPTARALKLPDGRTILLTDTVGFISRLPHDLVEAFKSTLEEVVYSDLILNVCDASDPLCEDELSVTNDIINQLGAADKPMITVYNKSDLIGNIYFMGEGRDAVRISALRGTGIDNLLNLICKKLGNTMSRARLLVPYSDGSVPNKIRQTGRVLSEEYTPEGIELEAYVDVRMLDSIREYVIEIVN